MLAIIQTAVTFVFAPAVCLYLVTIMTDCTANSPHGSYLDFQVRYWPAHSPLLSDMATKVQGFRPLVVIVLEYGHHALHVVHYVVLHAGVVLDGLRKLDHASALPHVRQCSHGGVFWYDYRVPILALKCTRASLRGVTQGWCLQASRNITRWAFRAKSRQ